MRTRGGTLNRAASIAAGTALTLGVAIVVALASQLSWGRANPPAGELRLSWRVRNEPDRVCRRRTPEELARLPRHMREDEVCEQRMLPYRLKVVVGDSVRDDRAVVASGARADRPLYVFGRFLVPAGLHAVRVSFAREGPPPVPRAHADSGPTHMLPPAAPPALTLDTTLSFRAGVALVVTFDEQRGRLSVIGPALP